MRKKNVTTASATDHLEQRLAYSVDEAATVTGLSRDLLYDQMRTGKLGYLKVGRRGPAKTLVGGTGIEPVTSSVSVLVGREVRPFSAGHSWRSRRGRLALCAMTLLSCVDLKPRCTCRMTTKIPATMALAATMPRLRPRGLSVG